MRPRSGRIMLISSWLTWQRLWCAAIMQGRDLEFLSWAWC